MPTNRTRKYVAAGAGVAVLAAVGLVVTLPADATSAPTAPQELTATSLSTSSERLDWQTPTTAGSRPIKRYDVRDVKSGSTTHTTKPTVRTYKLTKLTAKTHTYEVRAVSADGNGKWAKVTFTPGDTPMPTPSPTPFPSPTDTPTSTPTSTPTADTDGGGTSQLEDQVLNGCRAGVDIVPGQGTATGAALNTILANSCSAGASTSAPYKCLSGDPGQPDAGQVEDSWKALIDSGETVTLPVFCAVHPTSTPTCASSSITGTGTNTVFPVHKFVSVVVCGYHFSKQDNTQYARPTPTADCSSAAHTTALNAMLADDGNTTGTRAYLVLTFKTVQVSGGVSPSTCKIGDPCDGGTRQVRLIAGPYTE